jgi:hypothetical protein
MPILIDPITQQRVIYDKRSGDLQYDLVGDKAISEETVPVIGSWEDYTGSAIVNSRSQQMNQGRSNALFGEDPGIKGEKLPDLGIVGQNIQTTRRRTIRRNVKIKDGKVL